VHALSGRFVSDDYAGIIHFILKKDYMGYDIHASNYTSLNLTETNEYKRLAEIRPEIGITYTTHKLNFFGTCSYGQVNRNIPSSKYLRYDNSELASFPAGHSNNLSEQESNSVTGGLNYQITPFQLVGIQGDYVSENIYTFQEYTMRRTDLTNNHDRVLTNTTENRMKDKMFTATLFYQGKIGKRLHLYGDFSYNYYYNEIANEYRQDEISNYRYADLWDEYKNQTVFNLEGKYIISGKMSAETGYSNIRRRYASESSLGKGFLDYNEYRNKSFVYLSYYPSDKIGLKSGIAIEQIKKQDRGVPNSYFRALPYFHINYKINRNANIRTGYATNQSYPLLYQLSPMSIVIDTFMTQIGNPALKSSVRHNLFVQLSLWNKLKITPRFDYIRDGISEVYDKKGYKIYCTFDNMNMREYSLQASYDQILNPYFRLKSAIMFYHSEALHKGIHNSLDGWIFQSEINYYHSASSFGAQAGYYRNMKKHVLRQGYQMSDKDYWCVSLQKKLWHKRISVALSYIPPLTLGIRYEQMKEMNSPLYEEKTILGLDSYSQMLILKVSVNFERGGVKPAGKHTSIRNDEREF
jgi:hypothetical protein